MLILGSAGTFNIEIWNGRRIQILFYNYGTIHLNNPFIYFTGDHPDDDQLLKSPHEGGVVHSNLFLYHVSKMIPFVICSVMWIYLYLPLCTFNGKEIVKIRNPFSWKFPKWFSRNKYQLKKTLYLRKQMFNCLTSSWLENTIFLSVFKMEYTFFCSPYF